MYIQCVCICMYIYVYLLVRCIVCYPTIYTNYIHIIYILYTCIYMYVLGALLWIWTPGLQDSPELELEMEGSLLLSVLDTACLGLSRLAGTSEALVNLRKSPRSFRIPSTKLANKSRKLVASRKFCPGHTQNHWIDRFTVIVVYIYIMYTSYNIIYIYTYIYIFYVSSA